MKKKVLSILLCVAMVIAMTPSMVFANVAVDADSGVVTFSNVVTNSDITTANNITVKKVFVTGSNIVVSPSSLLESFIENFFDKLEGLVLIQKGTTVTTLTNVTATTVSATDVTDVYFGENYKPATSTILSVTATDAVMEKLDKAGFPVKITKENKSAELCATEYFAIYYGDIETAVKDAKSGDIINILATYSGKPLVANEGVKVNKNGFFANVDEAVASVTFGGTTATCSTIQQAYEKLNATTTNVGTIKLLQDVDQNLVINSDKDVTLDLNGKVLKGNITVFGHLVIKDDAKATDSDLGKGEVTGDLIYSDKSHISIVEGIFADSNENGNIVASGSQSFIMTLNGVDKWVVADEAAAAAMTFGLKYEVYDSDGNLVTDTDSEPGLDFAVGEEYKAKIYITNDSAVKIRAFDFTATYDPSLIKVSVPYSAENKYTTLGTEWNQGELHYTMAVNDNVKGNDVVAVFNFKINDETKDLKVRDVFTLGFKNDATVGTMKSINEIPVNTYTDTKGFIANKLDGVVLVDYAYAPANYVLAIIANDTTSSADKKFNLEGYSEDKVYYTTNPEYVKQSTNPKGLDIYGNEVENAGVYLVFIPGTDTDVTATNVVANLIKHEEVGYTVFDTTNYLNGNVDVNHDQIVNANDASVVYQMLIYDEANSKGSKWGFEAEADNSQLYIPTFQRLLSESNFDGKLYGTIEDVNNIINFYTKLNLY